MSARRRIPGIMDLHALGNLAHRPQDSVALRREAVALVGQGLSVRDVGAALRLHPGQVHGLLGEQPENQP